MGAEAACSRLFQLYHSACICTSALPQLCATLELGSASCCDSRGQLTSDRVDGLGVLDLPDAALEGVGAADGLALAGQVRLHSAEAIAVGVLGSRRRGLKVLLQCVSKGIRSQDAGQPYSIQCVVFNRMHVVWITAAQHYIRSLADDLGSDTTCNFSMKFARQTYLMLLQACPEDWRGSVCLSVNEQRKFSGTAPQTQPGRHRRWGRPPPCPGARRTCAGGAAH